MKKNEFKQDNKGFSLVEIIIVIAVMAILTGFMAPQVMTYVEESRQAKDLQMMNSVFTAVQTAVALHPDNDIIDKTIEQAMVTVPKIKELLGPDMDTLAEIKIKAKSKKVKDDASINIYVNYTKSDGKLKLTIGTSPTAPTLGEIINH